MAPAGQAKTETISGGPAQTPRNGQTTAAHGGGPGGGRGGGAGGGGCRQPMLLAFSDSGNTSNRAASQPSCSQGFAKTSPNSTRKKKTQRFAFVRSACICNACALRIEVFETNVFHLCAGAFRVAAAPLQARGNCTETASFSHDVQCSSVPCASSPLNA